MKIDGTEEKTCVVRECMSVLLKDHHLALVLEQLIYWSLRTKDYDLFLQEELKLIKTETGATTEKTEKRHGWIYKTAKQLSEELMDSIAPSTVSKCLVELEKLKYIEVRQNPKYKWDHTKQYRPDCVKIQTDLFKLGYIHDKIGISLAVIQSVITPDKSNSTTEKSMATTEKSSSISDRTIPENTTKTTPKTTTENKSTDEPSLSDEFSTMTGIMFYNNEKWGKSMQAMVSNGVDIEILRTAYYDLTQGMVEQGKKAFTISGPWSLEKNAIALAAEKRKTNQRDQLKKEQVQVSEYVNTTMGVREFFENGKKVRTEPLEAQNESN